MTLDTEHEVACQGCGTTTTTAFQCPLCQAEGATDRGFFCSQKCFADNWLEHRNTLHSSGVVRERKPAAAAAAAAEATEVVVEGHKSKRDKKRARDTADDGDGKEGNGGEELSAAQSAAVFPPWPALPSAAACAEHHWAVVAPALPLDVPRAVVRPSAAAAATTDQNPSAARDEGDYVWSALLAAAQYTAASIQSHASMQVLVVAGDVYSAHAFAWAARCVGLTGMLHLAVANLPPSRGAGDETESAEEALRRTPSKYFTSHKRVVIATSAVVRATASAVSGAASLWLTGKPAHSLLLTLPDVVEPADLQGVQTRAVFFTGPNGTGEAEEEATTIDASADYTYTNVEVKCEDGAPLLWRPVTLPAPGMSAAAAAHRDEGSGAQHDDAAPPPPHNAVVHDARHLSPKNEPAARLDDEVSTCFANGDVTGALHRLVRRYQRLPGHFESTLFYLLCCNWGAAGVAHAHHRLAHIARFFADQSTRFDAKKTVALVDAALRAVAAVVRLLPRLKDDVAEAAVAAASRGSASKRRKTQRNESASAATPTLASTTRPQLPIADASAPSAGEVARLANYYTSLPNLQLQATVCHLFTVASAATLETFARAWGLYRYLPGPSSLARVEKARNAAVLRVRQRYSTKLGADSAAYLTTLMQLIYDAVGPYSLSVDEVRRRLQWDVTLAYDVGSLESYLQCCALLPNAEGLLLPTTKKQQIQKVASTPAANATAASGAASSSSESAAAAAAAGGGGAYGGGRGVVSLSSRQPLHRATQRETPRSRTEKLRGFAVKTATTAADNDYGFLELPWRPFPISGERQRRVDRLHKSAVEEVLMAMPREPRPLYVGDIGNLIGKWGAFNARFDGTLGATLQVFLEAHPAVFRVVGELVTRRVAGTTEPVRVRYDAETEGGRGGADNDDDGGSGSRAQKNRDRQLLTGQTGKRKKASVELPARARKRRAVKEFNKSRFNRNYKSVDASARVPGYIKRGPRRIKGRGNKANKRVVKRGS
ncbi:hypothetical protein ABB37_09876 [Leptomonas pyrrhocoris]|uniref:C6H2-type domain-containing protein n=1 Tax=Leptomonas pyrrhocoris TaxID=157538 RepID=A0A0M9FPP3_LEPPY|nr:hypothetical protein ABB37_09876 [Leptomonas pyrrhocoris]KPA73433.1 hypothetical protein ABB37_09876 [Leptomonas pyrrhocoris]|eukprot:XP_015651872.1 hypothetical protein ABB37_09876 [Leptomonas pyrrhocoris]